MTSWYEPSSGTWVSEPEEVEMGPWKQLTHCGVLQVKMNGTQLCPSVQQGTVWEELLTSSSDVISILFSSRLS